MKKTRRGFTLVELLIVIVVIGVLAAMMMLSSSEAVSSARASTIITNLRNLKTAALAMYNDNMDTYDNLGAAESNKTAGDGTHNIDEAGYNVLQYLSGKGEIPDKDDYWLLISESTQAADINGWYIVYNASGLGNGTEAKRIRDKLKGRAKSLGLLAMGTSGYPEQKVYDGTTNVAIQVR